jgi:RNA polymerase sigma factor (sigma-70 family)
MQVSRNNSVWETVFTAHYPSICRWARRLTAGKRDEAEDLVQELYLRLACTASRPLGMDDDQVRGYLYNAMRNLLISFRKRSLRDRVSGVEIVDLDSVKYRLATRGRNDSVAAWSDLVGVCEYVCIRRKSSKVAAVCILRYFLGYSPEEVMAILAISRSAYDTHAEISRLEAQAYLSCPRTLRFVETIRRRNEIEWSLPEEEHLLLELQRLIFAEAEGPCFTLEFIAALYGKAPEVRLNNQTISHLVSCRACLREATNLLGIACGTLGTTVIA